MTWASVPLKRLAVDMQPGFACQPTTTDPGVPQLRTNNVSAEGRLDLSELKHVPASPAEIGRYSLMVGDILFNNTNSPALVGKTAFFRESGQFLFSNHMTRIRIDLSLAEPRYVARFLHWRWSQGAFRHLVTQWVNQAAINRAQLATVPVPLPALSEQRRIVEILDQADRLLRLRADADAKAERILPALFTKMFVDTASSWEMHPLGSLLRKKAGALQSGPFGTHLHNSDFVPEGTVLAVGIDNVVDGEFVPGRNRRITNEKYRELEKYTLDAGDVLITIMGTVGRSCVFPGVPSPAICTKHVYRIQVDDRVHPEYLSAALRLAGTLRDRIAGSITGQIVAGITSADLRALQVTVPPRRLQDAFAKAKADLDANRERSRRATNRLGALFTRLLQDAFSGDLTATWRKAHMTELLEEMEQQTKTLAEIR